MRSAGLKPEIDERLEAGGDGLVDNEDHQGTEDGLQVYRGGDEQVHGPFF